MRFGPVPIRLALGAVAAHSVRLAQGVIRKGATVTADGIAALEAADVAEIVVARLDGDDLGENDAATLLARHAGGDGLRADSAFTGRVNLFARQAGVLVIDEDVITGVNGLDEAITVATLPNFRAVVAGEMVATVKIIPYGVAERVVAGAVAAMATAPPLRIAPFVRRRVSVVSTLLPGLKPGVVDKTLQVMAERLRPAGASICADLRVAHEIAPLADVLLQRAAADDEIIIVFGASAMSDRRDVIPAALAEAGGTVVHLGMPVDPGNLIMLGEIGGKPVVGAPGCARSPKENGFDWVLQRLLAGIPVTRADIQRMGVGGLLMEIISRPQPRTAPLASKTHSIPAIVLAAGRSTRMGGRNKLTEPVGGVPLVRHVVQAALASHARPVLVVTGHEAGKVQAALAGLDVTFVDNAAYAEGMATSLKAGIVALPAEAPAVLVMLGDMPHVTSALANRLIALFGESTDAAAIVPTLLGQRGNPVLLARRMFKDAAGLSGDEGARRLLLGAGDAVVEAPLDDPATALDIDTPEALAALATLPAGRV